MWYDVVVVGLLLFFAVRGASRGLVWQVAGIAGIVLCLTFAETISAAVGPQVPLEPPLNHWVVMFGAYLFFSFLAFGFARVLNEWIEKSGMEHFNRHIGAVFGLLKGIVLCLVLTYFVVTLSPKSREALRESRTGYAAAIIMDRLHPIMPEKLHDALGKYIHQLDSDDMDLHAHKHDHDHHHHHHGDESGLAGDGIDLGGASPLPDSWNQTGTTSGESGSAIDQFLARLPQTVSEELRSSLRRSLEATPASERSALQQQILDTVSRTRPEDLPRLRQLINEGFTLRESLSHWMNSFAPPPVESPATQSDDQLRELTVEISKAFSSIPPVQVQIQEDIIRRLSGLPGDVGLAVLTDWRRDLWAPEADDPDPQTDANSPLENRIQRQLKARGYPASQANGQPGYGSLN